MPAEPPQKPSLRSYAVSVAITTVWVFLAVWSAMWFEVAVHNARTIEAAAWAAMIVWCTRTFVRSTRSL